MLRKLSNILSLLHQFAFEIVETRKKRMEGKSWEFLTLFQYRSRQDKGEETTQAGTQNSTRYFSLCRQKNTVTC